MADLIYIPAIGEGQLGEGEYDKEMVEKLGFNQNFLTQKSAYYYPKFLISAFYGMRMPEMREKYRLQDIFIIGDSGGFQNVTQNANLNPVEVITWQQKNCDSGLILDVPPYSSTDSAQFGASTNETFKEALQKTVYNAEKAMEHWTTPNFKLYGVIQGGDEKDQKTWFDKMINVEKKYNKYFSGWSLSPKPSHDIKQIAQQVGLLMDNKLTTKECHVLQVSGFESLAFCAYASNFFNVDITVDSSTYNIGRIYMTYFSPYDFLDKWEFGYKENDNFLKLGCDCPVCSRIDINMLKQETWTYKSIAGILISLHNKYQLIKYVYYLNSLKTNKKKFLSFCEKNFGQKFLNMVNFLDDIKRVGKNEAYRKNVIKSNSLDIYFEGIHITEEEKMEIPVEELKKIDENVDKLLIENTELLKIVKEEKMKLIKMDFPNISEKGLELLYKQQYGDD